MKKIGDRIRTIRAMKRLTQANVAEELGITNGAYAKIERGETDASASRLTRIAEILEVNVTEFFEESRKISHVNEQENPYGYASKSDVEQLSKSIQILLKEIEKMKAELQETAKKKKVKKK